MYVPFPDDSFFLSSPRETMKLWDVSQVSVFSSLFKDRADFNEDISNWNVSRGVQFVSHFNRSCQIPVYESFVYLTQLTAHTTEK